ncbi:hypothetical protein Tco_1503051 [Tanacetum coccineum]
MLLAPGQPIPHGRPYRYHLNGPIHMMTARKEVLDRFTHSSFAGVDISPDHFSSDFIIQSIHQIFIWMLHLILLRDTHFQIIAGGPSARDEGPPYDIMYLHYSTVSGALSPVSDEPHLEQDCDPEIQAEIDECFAYADALRDRGIDARVVVEAIDRDETETGVRGPVEVRVSGLHILRCSDIPELCIRILGAVEATYETLGDLVQRFHDHTQAIPVHRIQTIEGMNKKARTEEMEMEEIEMEGMEKTENGNRNGNHGQCFGLPSPEPGKTSQWRTVESFERLFVVYLECPDEETGVEGLDWRIARTTFILRNVIAANPARLHDAITHC